MGLGFPHRAERCRPGRTDFRPRVGGVVETWNDVWTGDGALSSPVAAGLGGLPRGARARRPTIARARGGKWLHQSDWDLENAGMNSIYCGIACGSPSVDLNPRPVFSPGQRASRCVLVLSCARWVAEAHLFNA